MARPLRINYKGAWYHVMNRGASRREVFPEHEDRTRFLRLLADLPDRFQLEIHAYCLMGNHYHLLLRTPQPNLSHAMRHIDGVYTQRFHRQHGGDGPLFRGRFRAVLVQADRHLLHVSRYIHLNPVEGGLVSRPQDWHDSSYGAYLDPAYAPPWLMTHTILGWFGSIGSRIRYRQFTDQGLDPGTRDFYGKARIRPVLGDDAFREEIKRLASLEYKSDQQELSDFKWLQKQGEIPLSEIGRIVCLVFDVSRDALRPNSRGKGREYGLVRGAFVHAARNLQGYRLREIAAWLGYRTYQSVALAAQSFEAESQRDASLVKKLESIYEHIARERGRS